MSRPFRTSSRAALAGAAIILLGCSSLPSETHWGPDEPSAAHTPSGTSTTEEPSSVERFDPSAHPLGAKWVWAEFDKVEPYLTEIGGGNTYVEIVLCDVQESPGMFDWSVPDSQISRARAIGFGSLVKLRTGRCWATPGGPKHPRGYGVTESAIPEDMNVYSDFVDRAVQRYTKLGVTEFAIENEVNSPYFWDGTPEEYEALARLAAETIHAAAPDALVVDGSVSSAGTGYAVADGLLRRGREAEAVATYQTYYQRRIGTRGGSASIDEVTSPTELQAELTRPGPARAVTFMHTIDKLVAEGVFDVRQVHYYETWQALPATLAHIRRNTPDSVPIEVWELGIWDADRTVSQADRTAEMVRATVIALGAGVEKVLWLPLLDNPDGRLGATLYGLVAPSGEPRGASSSFALLAEAAANHADITPLTYAGMMGATFDSTPATMVAWATTGEVGLPPMPGAVRILLDDQTTNLGEGQAVTSVGSQPVLITTNGTVSAFEEFTE